MAEAANHIFLPWVQAAATALIPDQATDTLAANQPAVISLAVHMTVNAAPVDKTVRLYGPGDVTGIDAQQVVRVEPQPGSVNFEPNYFPAIEFDRPDFPWLFTPAKAAAQGRLRPWLCLVVVRKQPGVQLVPGGGQTLPVLEIQAPASPAVELPDLSESYLWAHAQVTGAAKAQLKSALDNDPTRSVSRLLCPRRLDPLTAYIACVVPAFDIGVKAGLGRPITSQDEGKLDPAWLSGSQAPTAVTLPVYYSWEFQTGVGGDFEVLARQLQPHELPASVGKRPMDISAPGFKLQPAPPPGAPGTVLGLEGALRVVGSTSDAWPNAVRGPFQAALARILNLPWQIATQAGANPDPVLAPPIYGSWPAAIPQVGARVAPPPPIWLDDLNLDPRNRVAAAMGTGVVQQQQEQLMASAWAQLGDIQRVNQRLRQAQLSRAVNNRYYAKTFSRLPAESFLQIVAPAQSRIVLQLPTPGRPLGATPVSTLLVQTLASSPIPASAVSAPIRRLARPRGAVNRQLTQAGSSGIKPIVGFFNNGGLTIPERRVGSETGAVTIDQVSDQLSDAVFRLANLSSSALASIQPAPTQKELFDAALAHQRFLEQAFTTSIPLAPRIPLPTADIKTAVLTSISPDKTVPNAALAGLTIKSPPLQTGDPLDPIMDAPTFPQPMYEGLRDLSQADLFPGLGQVPDNTVQLLQTNPSFVESFMVGLNAAMGRELLWRGYPTDQRGTYFQRFWDALDPSAAPDIPAIHEWGTHKLGENAISAAASGSQLVLLIRGELLRRYPNTVIYAVKAVQNGPSRDLSTNPADESHPLFRGTLEPDVTFVGFNLTAADVVRAPGWYFVLQQQPTEPRFGLDDVKIAADGTEIVPELKGWDDLNWAHLAPTTAALKQLSHVSVNKAQLTPTQPTRGVWGRNSAHMAYITKQQPVRVAIHVTELLPMDLLRRLLPHT